MMMKMPVLPFKDTVSTISMSSQVEAIAYYPLLMLFLESSRRICRFYETFKGCMKGADCQFLHLEEGVVSLFIC